jgi:hypothetical protein
VYFNFGELMHNALQRFYVVQDEDPWTWFEQEYLDLIAGMDPTNVEYFNENVTNMEMGVYLLRAYERFANKYDRIFQEVVRTEERHRVHLPNGHVFAFKFDGLVLIGDKYYLLEFKTTQSFPSSFEWLDFDDQSVAYQWAAQEALGLDIAGIVYTFIRKKYPTIPKPLASGKLPKRKNIVTTVEAYEVAVTNAGLHIDDYVDFIDNVILPKESDDLFLRYTSRATGKHRAWMGRHIGHMLQMMSDERVHIYPSPDRIACSMCSYRSPCFAQSSQAGYNHILKQDYEHAEPRY